MSDKQHPTGSDHPTWTGDFPRYAAATKGIRRCRACGRADAARRAAA